MPFGALILGVCLVVLGGVNSIWLFFVAAVVGRAVSQPLLIGVVPRTIAVNFFQRRRNQVLSLTGIFRPISGAIIIQIISAIAVTLGWRIAFRYIGLMSFVLAVPLILLVRRRPEDIGLLPDGAGAYQVRQSGIPTQPSGPSTSNPRHSAAASGGAPESNWTAREAMSAWAFWLVSVSVFLGVTGSSGLGFSLVPYLHEEAGLSIPQAAGVLSLSTVLALSSLGWGYLADRITPRWCMVVAMSAAAGVVLYLFSVDSLIDAYIFGVLWGVLHSSLEVLVYMVLARYFGRSSYGAIAGALRPFEAGGLGLGQSPGPIIYDLTASYSYLILTSAAVHLLAVVLILLARPPSRPPSDVVRV
jgi:sugar phosphate permease